MKSTPPTRPPSCPKCGSTRTTIAAKSEVPPMSYVRCEACGHMTAVATR